MNEAAGHPALFAYPARAALGRKVPKSRIYAAGRPKRRVRDAITAKVAQIVWEYKLAPETLKLPESRPVPEIQVFSVILKGAGMDDDPPDDILRCIDRAVGFPIVFELRARPEEGAAADQVKVAAAYKRPSEAETGKWVIGEYMATDWLPADAPRTPLPVALDMARLYEQMLRKLFSVPARRGESLADLAERQRRIAVKEREYKRLEVRVHREKQFNRRVELNRELRALRAELDALTR